MSGYDFYVTTDPNENNHRPECNCERCHEAHIEAGTALEHAKRFPQDYQCCVDYAEENELI